MGGESDVSYGEVRSEGSRRSGCREPDTVVSSTMRAESSLISGSLRKGHGEMIHSEKNVPVVLIKVISSSKWHEDLTTKRSEYRTGSLSEMNVHREGVGNGANGCMIVCSLELFRRQTVDTMVRDGTKNVGEQKFRHGRPKKFKKVLYYRRVLREDEVVECSLSKELELTNKDTVQKKAVSDRVTSLKTSQRQSDAKPENMVQTP